MQTEFYNIADPRKNKYTSSTSFTEATATIVLTDAKHYYGAKQAFSEP